MDLLTRLGRDEPMESLFEEEATVQLWLDVEAALTRGLERAGLVDRARCARIVAACSLTSIDLDRLWKEAAVVGYPIFPLVRMVCEALDDDDAGFVHYGATTQDIMDTALALQLRAAVGRVLDLIGHLGDGLATLVEQNRDTVMAGRTHAQQAVPTTFGVKCAGFLDQLTRDRARLREVRERVAVASLFGAGGTSAALGGRVAQVRAGLAESLGLAVTTQPWHVARDRVTEAVQVMALTAGTCTRLAREVIDLSRTEIGEVAEVDGDYRGASSTMPQKANPISAEMTVGFGVAAGSAAAAMLRALEAGHERSAGEWQVEWQAVPLACRSTAGALRSAHAIVGGLRVFSERMRANLALDGGRIMAEAYMFALAERIGRDRAHEVMYRAVRASRAENRPLADTLAATLTPDEWAALPQPEQYLGDADRICRDAVAAWRG